MEVCLQTQRKTPRFVDARYAYVARNMRKFLASNYLREGAPYTPPSAYAKPVVKHLPATTLQLAVTFQIGTSAACNRGASPKCAWQPQDALAPSLRYPDCHGGALHLQQHRMVANRGPLEDKGGNAMVTNRTVANRISEVATHSWKEEPNTAKQALRYQ